MLFADVIMVKWSWGMGFVGIPMDIPPRCLGDIKESNH